MLQHHHHHDVEIDFNTASLADLMSRCISWCTCLTSLQEMEREKGKITLKGVLTECKTEY